LVPFQKLPNTGQGTFCGGVLRLLRKPGGFSSFISNKHEKEGISELGPQYTKLEAETRKAIDAKLDAAGWVIQDKNRLNLYESLGVAVREMDNDTGRADYMLFVNGEACGIIEAKREGTDLGGVAEQSQRYATSRLKHIQRAAANDQPLPYLYEATNHEIRFRDERDPSPRSRYVFHFHTPETLKDWLEEGRSLRDRLLDLP
jgi:type I restriction enzyme R subunit